MKNILVATDFSEESKEAFYFAKEQALLAGKDVGRIHMMFVLQDLPARDEFDIWSSKFSKESIPSFVDEAQLQATQRIKELCHENFNGFNVETAIVRTHDSVAAEIAAYASSHNCNLVVVTSHGRTGIKKILLGSVASELLPRVTCPALVVPVGALKRAKEKRDLNARKHIIVTTDFSEKSLSSFEVAKEQLNVASDVKPQLTLLHVLEDVTRATYHFSLGGDLKQIKIDMKEKCLEELNKLRDKHFAGLAVNTSVIDGIEPTYVEIAAYSRTHHVDMIIMSRHGRTGFSKMFVGSNTAKILPNAHCPVLIVP
ncbi:MAG: universal stress protein [Deltaproteobacteria bacterium]|nr:universal stress protein [Deltaproteobacteria bacterium]